MLIAAGLGACLSSENIDLGRNLDSGAPGLASVGLDAASPADAGGALLSAAISASTGTICAGDCVDLFATASGTGPYAYAWGQGLGEGPGPKSVCPVATTTYSVLVSSSASEQQSTASAMVAVVPCEAGTAPPHADAGAAQPPPDSGAAPPSTASLCVMNSSFEGPTMVGTSGPPGTPQTAAPPQWQVCLGTPDVDPSLSLQPPSDGMSYVGLAVGSGTFSNFTESLGTALCAALQPGKHYSFCVDLGTGVRGVTSLTTVPNTPPPELEIWGGRAQCSEDALLWTSPPITNTDSWAKVCGTFVPSQAYTNITIIPAQGSPPVGPGAWSYVIVDHLVAGP